MLVERNDIPNRKSGEKVYAAPAGTLVKVSIALVSPADQNFSAANDVSVSIMTSPVGEDGRVLENNGVPMEPPPRTVTMPLTGAKEMDTQPELDEAIESAVEEAANWVARVTSIRQTLASWAVSGGA